MGDITLTKVITASFVRVSRLFANETASVSSVVAGDVNALVNCLVMHFIARGFAGHALSSSGVGSFCLVYNSMNIVVFFLRPFISA